MKKQWYEEFFANYANSYEREPFVKGTSGEEGIKELLQFQTTQIL